jgi:hypothetical protein
MPRISFRLLEANSWSGLNAVPAIAIELIFKKVLRGVFIKKLLFG